MDCVWQRDENLGASCCGGGSLRLTVPFLGEDKVFFLPEMQGRKGPEHQRATHSAHKNCIQSNLLFFFFCCCYLHTVPNTPDEMDMIY